MENIPPLNVDNRTELVTELLQAQTGLLAKARNCWGIVDLLAAKATTDSTLAQLDAQRLLYALMARTKPD